MPLNFNKIAVDPLLAKEGVWVKWIHGAEFKVARLGNAAHRAATQELLAEVRNSGKTLEPETQEMREFEARCLARGVLIDWKGVVDDAGKPVPYSEDYAVKLLSDEQYDEFVTFLLNASASFEHFRRSAQEASAGK